MPLNETETDPPPIFAFYLLYADLMLVFFLKRNATLDEPLLGCFWLVISYECWIFSRPFPSVKIQVQSLIPRG